MSKHCEEIFKPRSDGKNAEGFIAYLECLAGFMPRRGTLPDEEGKPPSKIDRAALAQLRRALGRPPDRAFQAFPYVVRWAEQARADGGGEWHEECYYLVASLFAMYHTRSWHHSSDIPRPQRTLGDSFLLLDHAMRRKLNSDERSKSLERRFTALLTSRRQDLPERLRQAVSLLKSNDVPIDWLQLLEDLLHWEQGRYAPSSHSRSVSSQRKWAKSFWRIETGSSSDSEAESGGSADNDSKY